MAVIEELDENLTRLIYSEKYIAIIYYTDDCDNCKSMGRVFAKFSNSTEYSNVVFVKIRADNNPIAQQYIKKSKTSIMVFYKDGLLISSNTVASEKEMKCFLDELIENKS